MPDGKAQATVTIEGIDVKSQVESVDVEDHDRAIDRARVVFDSADDISQIVREQTKVKINLGWSDENALIFEGLVMGVKTEAVGMGQSRVTLTAYDLSYRLKQNQTKDRLFTSGKLSDALAAILADYPDLTVGQILPDPDPTFTPEATKQWGKRTGQSDWDFVQSAALRWKARAFVEINNGKSQFYFVSERSLLKGDPMGTLHYCPGGVGPLLEFKFQRIGSGAAPVSSATAVDPKTGQPVTQQAPPPDPEAPLQIDPTADATLTQAAGVMAQASGQPADSRPKDNIAALPSDPALAEVTVQQDPTRVLGYSGEGLCRGTIKLRAKGKVTIMGLPPWAQGDWYVHKVNHVFKRISVLDRQRKPVDRSTFETRFSATR
jgi:hypothetical protein